MPAFSDPLCVAIEFYSITIMTILGIGFLCWLDIQITIFVTVGFQMCCSHSACMNTLKNQEDSCQEDHAGSAHRVANQ